MINWALILGVSSGFGAATARAFAEEGYGIIGVHLDRASTIGDVKTLIEELKSKARGVHFFNVNAADAEKRMFVLDEIENKIFKKGSDTVRCLMHSLAFGTLKPYLGDKSDDDLTQKQLEMTIDVMGNSIVYWTRDVVRRNLMARGGKIFGMTSSGGHRVIYGYGAVSAAKAVLESHCRQLAMELPKFGISVSPVQAGVTNTPAMRKIPRSDLIVEDALRRNPFDRLTTPEDVAEIIVSITKQKGNWMNGNMIYADGGENIVEL
ncbi:MAG: SDR family oxidoreductase [Chlorobi bacterium]|nr:SDR family oxidoreductase [Chlorobiota bacterium]MCI0717131.1 SDR family oxidoreductase [Chlorobiota bacterium]